MESDQVGDQTPLDFSKLAMALQWAAYDLMPASLPAALLPRSAPVLGLGRIVATNILLGLTVELTLKGLVQRHLGSSAYRRTHDLVDLYESLPEKVQEKLATRFQEVAAGTDVAGRTLDALLGEHRKDFERWRYLDGDVDDLKSEPIGLHLAVCAMLDIAYEDEPRS